MLEQAGNANIDSWKPHDLRRTVASEMARLGIYQEVIEKIQNRSDGKLSGIAGVYNRYNYAREKLQAMERWHDELMKIIK
jgi:integrase